MIDELIKIDYSYSSISDDEILGEPDEFVNKVHINAHQIDEMDNEIDVVAKAEISVILLELADLYEFSEHDVLDATHEIMEMAESLFEWGSNKWLIDKLHEYYPEEIFLHYNILHLESIEVQPNWRGRGLGKYIIKNILEKYFGSCGIMTLKAFPYQIRKDSNNTKRYKELRLSDLEQDETSAKQSLYNYYKNLGFSNFNGDEYFIGLPYKILKTINNHSKVSRRA